jgi:hypothetical protein
MTLLEMKKKILSLIEELNPESEFLTDDPDIQAKLNEVINQVMFELVRFKKLPKYTKIEVAEGDVLEFADFERACGYEVYQVDTICGVKHTRKASGTVFKFLESGTAEIDLFVFPERITEKTKDKAYEFELTADVLEIMPYGVAGDLLKGDKSTEHGNVYSIRYENMKQTLDPRYQMSSISIEGGYNV